VEPLPEFSVLAGRFPTGSDSGAVLHLLEVVTTPGAAADINRVLQTLPGVQFVDEGNALYMRGGDSAETVTLLNGIAYPSAQRLDAPAGTFAATVNPFLTRKITFLAGGFGARHGNALSGVVDLETLGPPVISGVSASLGLGNVAGSVNLALPHGTGLRVTASAGDVGPILALNGSNRDYPEPPASHDLSVSVGWSAPAGAEANAFGLDQRTSFGLSVNEPSVHGVFWEEIRNRVGTFAWQDRCGAWQPAAEFGGGALVRRESIAGSTIETHDQHRQGAARVCHELGPHLRVSGGFDAVQDDSTLTKTAAGESVFSAAATDARWGAFAEADGVPLPHLRVIAGVRTDHSRLTERQSVDPRLSVAWEPRRAVSLGLAGGGYHQVPDGYAFLAPGKTTAALPPMRATHAIASLQLGRDDRFVRLEIYRKTYGDLVQLDRQYRPVAGGEGAAYGADLMLKTTLPGAVRARLTCSLVEARRTDPNSGRMAAAPFDVRESVTLLFERTIARWQTGLAWRQASGHPFTPVVSGQPTPNGEYAPLYGPPYSQRLPAFQRLDLSASRYWVTGRRFAVVTYFSLNNVLNRRNVYAYEYSADFASRRAVPGLFNRTLYFGCTLLFN